MSLSSPFDRAVRALREARVVLCLTGAGASAESGVPTFRDALTGLWSQFDPAALASRDGFRADPELVWSWYMERLISVERATPNAGHVALAELSREVPRFTVVTQNVDDLHERAARAHLANGADASPILHLHGEITRFRCFSCSAPHELSATERGASAPPRCAACGDLVRPGVVWFGEPLPMEESALAWAAARDCDVCLVVGTSGVVYPAAELPGIAKRHGAFVIDVNPEPTPISELADAFLPGPCGEILPRLLAARRSNE